MEDNQIVELFFNRKENAIKETEEKYGALCFFISHNILSSKEDAEECVNDTYLSLWNSIPPKRPNNFKAFICKVVRNLSLSRLEYNSAKKRSSNAVISIYELEEILPDESIAEISDGELEEAINSFLRNENEINRNVFLRRYWYFDSVFDIAKRFGYSESKVKTILFRTRNKLKEYLRKEGFNI